jgi:hypothetical protein
MSASGGSRGVLYVIVCAAPAAASVGELVELAQDAVPLVKEALARHVAFGRSREVLNEMGVRVLFDPQAPAVTHAKLANGAGGTAHCYRIQTRQEGLTWIARHAGSGLRGHAAAVACPKRRSRG